MGIEYGITNEAALGTIVDATPMLPLTADEHRLAMMVPRENWLSAAYVTTMQWPEALAALVTQGIYEEQEHGDYLLTPLGRERYRLTGLLAAQDTRRCRVRRTQRRKKQMMKTRARGP